MESNRENIVKLLFCGDFVTNEPKSIELSEEYRTLMNKCHIRCLNFEAPLPIGKTINIKGTAVLSQSFDSPLWCEEKGFNVISLANNHMGDFGEGALTATKEAFKSSLLVGAGDWEEAYKIKVMEINNVKIGFLSLAQCEFGILNDNWANRQSFGCAWINHEKVNNVIQNGKKTLDYLVIITHAGVEFCDFPLPEWRDRYKEMIDLGADAIIGGHPHVPQGWEMYNNRPIFYSLGNFYFDVESNRPFWNNGLTVILTINELKQVSYEVVNTIKINHRIEIDNSEMINAHNHEICKILSDDKKYIEGINNLCLRLWPSYEGGLLRALNGAKTAFSIKNLVKYLVIMVRARKPELRFVLNYLRCESHRFIIARAIKLLSKVKI